jgi:hypothetical protein
MVFSESVGEEGRLAIGMEAKGMDRGRNNCGRGGEGIAEGTTAAVSEGSS